MLEFLAPLRAPNELIGPSNSKPSLAAFQIPIYTEDNLQQILKIVLKARLPTPHEPD